MRNLRIVFIQETNWIDRNVIHQHHLAERLANRGHIIKVIDYDILWPSRERQKIFRGSQKFSDINRIIEGALIDVTRPWIIQLPLICHLSWGLSSLFELKHELDHFEPSIVIGLTLTNSYLLARLLKKYNTPYVSIVLEPYHTMVPYPRLWSIARFVESRAFMSSDRVVVFTPQMRDYVARLGVHLERVKILKTGVSLEVFHPGSDGSAHRTALGISTGEWVLFFMGWLYEFSGLREILHYIVKNPDIFKNARFVIVGDGDLYGELLKIIEDNKLEQRVLLLGRRPYADIPSLLATADVCLMPSLENETSRDIVPMKIYEYLAAGKPVVASQLPGLLAEFGMSSGIIYATSPIDGFEKAVSLRNRPEEVHRLSKAGRLAAEHNADWERTTDQFEELLVEIINTGGSDE